MKPLYLAGTCLVAVLAAGPATLAGAGVTGPAALAGAGAAAPAAPVVLTAVRVPQARVLNPSPPTGVAAAAGNAQVTLSWRPPTSNGGAAIIGYDVYMGTSPGGEGRSSVSGMIGGTSFTVTGLANGTTYYFTVDAVNDANLHSAPSAEVSARPVAPVTAPGAPSGLTATAGDAQVSLSWKAPGSDGGSAITGYKVYQGTGKNPAASVAGTSATVKGLANGTTYSFTVTAVNRAGEGPASGSVSATPSAAISKPGSPNGLTASPGNAQVTLSWTAPGSDGGAAIDGYQIYRGTSPGGESGAPVNGSLVHGTSFTVTGLANGTTYYFKVAAVNKGGLTSGKSGEASATPAANASASASASTSGSASASASTSASASASPVGGPSGPGAPGAPTGPTATAGQPTAKGVLASATGKMPKPVIVSLAAVAVVAVAAAAALTARRLRKRPRKRPPAAPPADVRAVPEPGPPSPVECHEIGLAETYVVRLEPLPAAIITTIEELTIEELEPTS
jgi:predicted phage tail protein